MVLPPPVSAGVREQLPAKLFKSGRPGQRPSLERSCGEAAHRGRGELGTEAGRRPWGVQAGSFRPQSGREAGARLSLLAQESRGFTPTREGWGWLSF